MRWRVRGPLSAWVVLGLLLTAACGSGPAVAPSNSGSVATVSPTLPTTALPTTPAYPSTSVPYLQAPPSLSAAWATYSVSIIPPANLFADAPDPTVVNMTNGALSDAQADALVTAHVREAVLEQWADLNDQVGFRFHLFSLQADNPTIRNALDQSYTVHAPICAFIGTSVSVSPIEPDLRSFLTNANQPPAAADQYVLVDHAGSQSCPVTAVSPTGKAVTLGTTSPGATWFTAGTVVADPIMGSIWNYDGAGSCATLGAPSSICS